ncbi:PilZ domain-containing protein [Hahella ganghwensis]|uniref:PilZ domain-containing protein n=1 Tax=Hahella ganghwensis TaxID=286420 RepID=UPI0012FBBF17|nr:PilZ domain-containing protein [Hahella ganghwensis]
MVTKLDTVFISDISIMTQDKRSSPRIKASFQVELTHPDLGTIKTKTRDISENGAFVIVNEENTPELHMRVSIRVLGLPGEPGAPVESEVVRIEHEGVGVKFIQDDDGELEEQDADDEFLL